MILGLNTSKTSVSWFTEEGVALHATAAAAGGRDDLQRFRAFVDLITDKLFFEAEL